MGSFVHYVFYVGGGGGGGGGGDRGGDRGGGGDPPPDRMVFAEAEARTESSECRSLL